MSQFMTKSKLLEEIDALIARHKATLDLLAKPATEDEIREPFARLRVPAHIQAWFDKIPSGKPGDRLVMNADGWIWESMIAPTPEEIRSAEETMSKWKSEPARTPIQKAEDLVGFYNKPGPAQECGCIDKAKLLGYLADQIKESQKDKAYSAGKEWFTDAARNVHREFAFSAVKEAIEAGRFDRAPCKPEPDRDPSWNAKGLDFGAEDYVNGSTPKGQPAPSKPALDKEDILDHLKFAGRVARKGSALDALEAINTLIEQTVKGAYDASATDSISTPDLIELLRRRGICKVDSTGKPFPFPITTAGMVELLRSRASPSNGIDVTDLGADQLMSIRWNRPATVIAVRKEENRS